MPENETQLSPDRFLESRIASIDLAFRNDFDIEDREIANWLRKGVYRRRRGLEVTVLDLMCFDQYESFSPRCDRSTPLKSSGIIYQA